MILGATFYWMEGNENKEQPIIKRDYLPDGIVALENAQRIAIAQNQNAINFDHIFWWSYGVIREDKNFPTFSSIVGFNNAKKLDEYVPRVELEGVTLKDLWDKENKLKWDWNSVK